MHGVKAGRESAQQCDVVKRCFSAYVRYLDLVASSNRGVDAVVGRVPTLAEWCGDAQWSPRLVFPVGVFGASAHRSVGATPASSEGAAGGCGAGVNGVGEKLAQSNGEAVFDRVAEGGCDGDTRRTANSTGSPLVSGGRHGPNWERNRMSREKKKQNKKMRRGQGVADSGVDCSSGASVGSVHTVDTRTGVEIEAAQTLAARRVAENKVAEAKAKVEMKLAEHRLKALSDKSRTKAVERLAAARMEEKINKAKKQSEEAFKGCDQSLKSLGSTGSAGEFALKTQIKDARDNEAILAYVQEQNRILTRNASPEVLDAISRVKKPVIEEEYDAFGDCPSDYDEDEAEAYNNDRNRRNDEMAQKLQCVDEAPLW